MDLHRAIDAPTATRQMRLLGLVPSEAHGGHVAAPFGTCAEARTAAAARRHPPSKIRAS